MRKGRFDELVAEVHTLRNTPSNVETKKAATGRRVQHGNFVLSNNDGGSQSPLALCEDHFTGMTAKLTHCLHSTASKSLKLINSATKNRNRGQSKIVEAGACLR